MVLSIAGSDSSGCAGLQADLRTCTAHGVHLACALTAVTAQTAGGVLLVHALPPTLVEAQIAATLAELGPQAVKVGMLGPAELVDAVHAALDNYRGPLVVDPVLAASSGAPLSWGDPRQAPVRRLFNRTTLLTPNLPEARILAGGLEVRSWCEEQPFPVLLKGGHDPGSALCDRLFRPGRAALEFRHPRIPTQNTRGTGCTLASAIAARLARGDTLEGAVGGAIEYVLECLRSSIDRPRRLGLRTPAMGGTCP